MIHVATLSYATGGDANALLAAMDNLNFGLAHIHQEAFQSVYENLKNSSMHGEYYQDADILKLCVDIVTQRNMADMASDKVSSSAIALTSQQPEHIQDAVANVWITGLPSSPVALRIRSASLMRLSSSSTITRMEVSFNTAEASIVSSIMGLKCVLFPMDQGSPGSEPSSTRNDSIASSGGAIFCRLSNAFAGAANARFIIAALLA